MERDINYISKHEGIQLYCIMYENIQLTISIANIFIGNKEEYCLDIQYLFIHLVKKSNVLANYPLSIDSLNI